MNHDKLPRLGITGKHTTNGVPHTSTTLTPFLAISRAVEAVNFYASVFDARVVSVTEINGEVVHAELDFGNGKLQLGEPNPEFELVAAPEGENVCYSMGLYCLDIEAVIWKARHSGNL